MRHVVLTTSELQSLEVSRARDSSQTSGLGLWPARYIVKQTGAVRTTNVVALPMCH